MHADEHHYAADDRPSWFEKKRNVRNLAWALYAACAILFALDFVIHRHAETAADAHAGFYAVFGFVGSVFLVMAAKEVLRRLVMRPRDYYDD